MSQVYHFAELPLKCRYFAPSDRNLLNEVIMTDLVTMRAEEKHCKFIAELARTKMATVGGGHDKSSSAASLRIPPAAVAKLARFGEGRPIVVRTFQVTIAVSALGP
jgi:hypothetical protein